MMLLHKQGAPALLLPEFLSEIFLGRRTGLLHLTHDEATTISFRAVNGELVSGSSSQERGRLGETMVRRGMISRVDLERALAIVSGQRRRLAPVLRELELVDTHGLEQALVLHVQELLVTALLWDQAALLFEDQELPDAPPEDFTLRCWMADLILEIVRQIPHAESVRKGLGNVDRPIAWVENPPFGIERITLSAADGYLLACADGATSARTAIASAPLPAEDVERSLLALLCTGIVRYCPAPLVKAPRLAP
jgi:hypothetical protein